MENYIFWCWVSICLLIFLKYNQNHILDSIFEIGPRNILFSRLITRNKKVEKIFHKICEAAADRGFKFKYPSIAVTKWWVGRLFFLGIAYRFENTIVIQSRSANRLNDSDLSSLIAHELGHLIDWQTKRTGHPFFVQEIVKLDIEKFAWAIAEYITSSASVNNFFDRKHDL